MEQSKQASERRYPPPGYNATHPELKEGENFVKNISPEKGNFEQEQAAARRRGQVLRLGETAYNDNGERAYTQRPLILTGEKAQGVRGRELHPECLPSEMCIGNRTLAEFLALPYETKRLGVNAYDINGVLQKQPDGDDREYPVFVLFAEFLELGSKVGH